MDNINSIKRVGLIVVTSYFLFAGLYYLKDVLIPLLYAAFFSMLVLPICKKIERKTNETLAVTLSVFIIVAVNIVFLLIMYFQIRLLAEDVPFLKIKVVEKFHVFQLFLVNHFQISMDIQTDYLEDNYSKLVSSGSLMAKKLFIDFTHSIVIFVLTIIYMFFMLLLRRRIKNFFLLLFPEQNHEKVRTVILKVKNLVLHYIKGLAIATLIVGIFNTIGLLALGIKHAIFWAILAALLNLIPYIGSVIAMIFPVLMALIYKDSIWYALGVVLVIQITHFVYAKFLTPKIIGAHIQINALATIVVIVSGGALWGLSGMILFLPLLGILKIIFDSSTELRPLGYLIGDDT